MGGRQSTAERVGSLIGALVALVGIPWAVCGCIGCGRNSDLPAIPKAKPGLPPPPMCGPPDSDSDDVSPGSGPVADARKRVKGFEKKRAALQPLLDKALAER